MANPTPRRRSGAVKKNRGVGKSGTAPKPTKRGGGKRR